VKQVVLFLQKRTKKPLLLKHLAGIGTRANGPKFLLLFSKRSACLLRMVRVSSGCHQTKPLIYRPALGRQLQQYIYF
jgi:hypothetical protein